MPAPNPPLTLKHRVKSALAFVLGHAAAALLAAAGRLWRLRVWHLRDDRIGHLVGDTDLFLRRRELGEIEPGIRILGFSGKPCNAAIVNVFARQFRILRGPVVSWLYRLVEPYLERTGFVIASTTRTTEYREFAATLPLLRLTPEEEARGRAELAKMGIGENDWWVCFHARLWSATSRSRTIRGSSIMRRAYARTSWTSTFPPGAAFSLAAHRACSTSQRHSACPT